MSADSPDYRPLFSALGYQFTDTETLAQALTHRSAAVHHNERLEFLGDAILSAVVAEQLFSLFPEAPEGALSRCRSTLVKGATLAQVAKAFGLGEFLHLGPGEMKSGGHRRESILADALEAVIGALFLEAGYATAKTIVLKWFEGRFRQLDPVNPGKDPKTRLQEKLQSRRLSPPVYDVISIEGQAHNQVFHVVCKPGAGYEQTFGRGSSRRKAEQAAAEKALSQLEW